MEALINVSRSEILALTALSKVPCLPTISELEDELLSAGAPQQSVLDSCWYIHVKTSEPFETGGGEVVSTVVGHSSVVFFVPTTAHILHRGVGSFFVVVTSPTPRRAIIKSSKVVTTTTLGAALVVHKISHLDTDYLS